LVVQFSKLIEANPDVVRGVAAAGIAFTALRLGIVSTIVATKLLSFAMKANPIGLAATGIALAAGLIVSNWSAIAPYFNAMWDKIRGPTLAAWEVFKTFASYTPIWTYCRQLGAADGVLQGVVGRGGCFVDAGDGLS